MGDELIKRVPAFPSSADDGPGVTQWMDPRLLFERQRAREGQRPRRVDTAYRGGRKRGVRPSAAPWLEDFFLFFFTFVLSTGSCHTDSHHIFAHVHLNFFLSLSPCDVTAAVHACMVPDIYKYIMLITTMSDG